MVKYITQEDINTKYPVLRGVNLENPFKTLSTQQKRTLIKLKQDLLRLTGAQTTSTASQAETVSIKEYFGELINYVESVPKSSSSQAAQVPQDQQMNE